MLRTFQMTLLGTQKVLRMDGQTNVEDTLLDLAAFHQGDAGNNADL